MVAAGTFTIDMQFELQDTRAYAVEYSFETWNPLIGTKLPDLMYYRLDVTSHGKAWSSIYGRGSRIWHTFNPHLRLDEPERTLNLALFTSPDHNSWLIKASVGNFSFNEIRLLYRRLIAVDFTWPSFIRSAVINAIWAPSIRPWRLLSLCLFLKAMTIVKISIIALPFLLINLKTRSWKIYSGWD